MKNNKLEKLQVPPVSFDLDRQARETINHLIDEVNALKERVQELENSHRYPET